MATAWRMIGIRTRSEGYCTLARSNLRPHLTSFDRLAGPQTRCLNAMVIVVCGRIFVAQSQ